MANRRRTSTSRSSAAAAAIGTTPARFRPGPMPRESSRSPGLKPGCIGSTPVSRMRARRSSKLRDGPRATRQLSRFCRSNLDIPAIAMRRIFIPVDINPAPLRPPIGLHVRTIAGATMGTTWSVKAAVPGGLQLDRLQYEIEAALAEIVRQMSPWEEQSCLSVFNRAPAGTWHRLPEEFFAVLAEATRIAEQTAGAFDPTVGSLVNRAGFGPILPTEPRSERDPTTARRSGLP